jgi:hypothetical protein
MQKTILVTFSEFHSAANNYFIERHIFSDAVHDNTIIKFPRDHQDRVDIDIIFITPQRSDKIVVETALDYSSLFNQSRKVILWCNDQSIADGKFGKTLSELLQLCADCGVKLAMYNETAPDVSQLYDIIVNMNQVVLE